MTPAQSSSRPVVRANTFLLPPHHDAPRRRPSYPSQRQLALEKELLDKYHEEARKASEEFEKYRKEVEERNKANCCTEGCVVT